MEYSWAGRAGRTPLSQMLGGGLQICQPGGEGAGRAVSAHRLPPWGLAQDKEFLPGHLPLHGTQPWAHSRHLTNTGYSQAAWPAGGPWRPPSLSLAGHPCPDPLACSEPLPCSLGSGPGPPCPWAHSCWYSLGYPNPAVWEGLSSPRPLRLARREVIAVGSGHTGLSAPGTRHCRNSMTAERQASCLQSAADPHTTPPPRSRQGD